MKFQSKNSLVIIIGPPAAGKTTFAAANFQPDEVISTDAIREKISKGEYDPKKNRIVFGIFYRAISSRLSHGLRVVADATNVSKAARKNILSLAYHDTKVYYVILDRPEKDRKADRPYISNKNMVSMSTDFKKELKNILSGDGNSKVTVYDLRHKNN